MEAQVCDSFKIFTVSLGQTFERQDRIPFFVHWPYGQICNNWMLLYLQVKVLEYESDLEKERIRLAELRKKHYQMAGESEGWEQEVSH